ncbi:MAG: VOC family protein [Chloroflexota bacterium]
MTDSPAIKTAVPCIPAQDLDATLDFYNEKLGFEIAFRVGDYAGIRRDGAEIHVYQHDSRALAEDTMYRLIVTGVDALCTEFNRKGINCEVSERPWGTRDMPVIDPAGNCLTFQEDVWRGPVEPHANL